MCRQILPLAIVADHPIIPFRGQAALIDTGSPLTLKAPALVSEQLRHPVQWLIGTDFLTQHRVLMNWTARAVVLNGDPVQGEVVDLAPLLGVFQIPLLSSE